MRDPVPSVPELARTSSPGTRPVRSSVSVCTGDSRSSESTSSIVTPAPSSLTRRSPVKSGAVGAGACVVSCCALRETASSDAMIASDALRMVAIDGPCDGKSSLNKRAAPPVTRWHCSGDATAQFVQSARCFRASRQTVLDDLSALHHEPDVLEHGHVLQRVAHHADHVGKLARLERADQIAPAEQIRGVDGGRLDRLQRRGAPAYHVPELFRVPAVRVHAGIGAVGDLHARLHRLLEVLTLLAAHQALFVDDLLGEAEARVLGDDVIVVVDVGDEVGAMLLHETDTFVVDQAAMLH